MTQVSEQQTPGPIDLHEYRLELDRKRQQISTTEVSKAVVGGPGGPYLPGMEKRVATLEADMKDVKGSLSRIETNLAVVVEGMKSVATKADLATLTGTVGALSTKTDGLAGRVDKVERTVDSKVLGPWQFPLILAASAAVLGAVFAAYAGLVAHGYLPH
ncbi:MAG: hypothetical protein EOO77_01005 [Oxalobacteraceae bacterium]|nr:MAG: hypothetical protein EOO77_01005 [Oxalobacteraceae bacterium]